VPSRESGEAGEGQTRAAIAVVIAGLDPVIHLVRKKFLRKEFLRRGWTRGANPRGTGGVRGRETAPHPALPPLAPPPPRSPPGARRPRAPLPRLGGGGVCGRGGGVLLRTRNPPLHAVCYPRLRLGE